MKSQTWLLGLLLLVLADGVHCHHSANLASDKPRLRDGGCGSKKSKALPAPGKPLDTKPAPAASATAQASGASNAAKGGVGKVSGVTRLDADELATGERLSKQLGRPLRESKHEGAEFVDDLGRTYDAMGKPAASKFWNQKEFLKAIDNHLLKANDFTAIDLTGFTKAQKATVRAYVDGLPAPSQARIIRIGF